MAKKYTVDLEVNTGKSDANIGDVVKAIKELNAAVVNSSKKSEESLEGVEDAAKKSASGVSKLGKIINNLAKAGGVIFLLNKAFDFFKEVASENQKVVDFFAITMETLSLAFNDLFKFIENNVGGVVNAFKSIFNDPLQAVKNLGNSIKNNIIERFNSALEVLGLLGSAAKKFFSGDFAGALEDAKSAGKEYIDVMTGVDDSFNKIGDAVSNAVDATIQYGKSTIDSAKNIVELNKASEKAGVTIQGLIEKYDREAELLRQIRDDSSKSIEERIKANEDLGVVLEKQQGAMQRQAQLIVDAAQAQYDKNNSDANSLALQEALNEQAAIDAQITGFKSEQQTNLNSLLQEQKDIQNELALIGKDELETGKLEAEQKLQTQIDLINREVSNEEERNRLLLEAQRVYEEEVATLQTEYDAKQIEIAKTKADELKAIQDKETADRIAAKEAQVSIEMAKWDMLSQATGLAQQLAGENEAVAIGSVVATQAAAIGQIIASTGLANAKALAASPLTFGQPWIGINTLSAGLSIASAVASGAKSIKDIKSSKNAGNAPSAPRINAPRGGGGSSQPPQFNVVGTSGTNQLAETIASKNQEPMKAYVVASDVTTAQSLERNIVSSASI